MEHKVSEKEFKELCGKLLPKFVRVDGINYRLHCYMLMGGDRFVISYGQYDGDYYHWDEKRILDETFVLVDKIPVPKKRWSFSNSPHELTENVKYSTSIEDIVSKAKQMLIEIGYEELEEIVTPAVMFERELASLLNRYSKENASDTPDYILANYLIGCLNTYNHTIQVREKWYNREMHIEGHNTDEENLEEVVRFSKELHDANEKAKKGEKYEIPDAKGINIKNPPSRHDIYPGDLPTSADVEKHCNKEGYYIGNTWFPFAKGGYEKGEL